METYMIRLFASFASQLPAFRYNIIYETLQFKVSAIKNETKVAAQEQLSYLASGTAKQRPTTSFPSCIIGLSLVIESS